VPYFYFRFVWPTDLKSIPHDPYVDNSHRVWSWYDHTLPSYSVFVCRYVTWPCDLDLLTLNSYHTWRVTWPTFPPSLKTLRLFVHELRVITVPVDYHWKCVRGHCACVELPTVDQFSPSDRAMRLVSTNLANYHATVRKLLIRQVLTKPMLWSWKFSWRQCVINKPTTV